MLKSASKEKIKSAFKKITSDNVGKMYLVIAPKRVDSCQYLVTVLNIREFA